MRFAILFAIQSVGILFFAVRFGGWMWVLAWPAISFAYVALAYFLNRPGMFAKSSNGEIPGWLAALLAPYFLMTWSVWMTVKYLSGENAYDEIDSQLILGRRVTVGELPAGVDRVVDLTAEFTEPRAIRDRVDYSLHRILDGHQPALDAFSVFARELAASSDVLFVHCAQGHGRTGMLAVAILLEKGTCESVDEAIGRLQACRPKLRVNSAQRRFLDRYVLHMQQR